MLMSESMTCPYCETKVKLSEVDAEDGTCPECGAPLLGTTLWMQQENNFEDEEDDAFFAEDDDGADYDEEKDEDDFFADDDEKEGSL